MSDVIIAHPNGDDEQLLPKNAVVDQLKAQNFLTCLDDILASNENPILVAAGNEHHCRDNLAPIVIVEPKIEINLELIDGADSESIVESFDRLKIPGLTVKKSKSSSTRSSRNKSNKNSVSPNNNKPTENGVEVKVNGHHSSSDNNKPHYNNWINGHDSDHNKENHRLVMNDANGENGNGDEVGEENGDRHHHRHHHNHTTKGHHHTHHHHNHHSHNQNGEAALDQATNGDNSLVSGKPDQVLRKYIIKKITIRKQDGSTKKIVIKKPVDQPDAPLKLSKVYQVFY